MALRLQLKFGNAVLVLDTLTKHHDSIHQLQTYPQTATLGGKPIRYELFHCRNCSFVSIMAALVVLCIERKIYIREFNAALNHSVNITLWQSDGTAEVIEVTQAG